MVLKAAIAYYVNNGSTVYCTMLAYYVNNGSTVYCTMLDATKAFDRVEYRTLFRLLVSRDLPSALLRLLLNMYTNRLAVPELRGTAYVLPCFWSKTVSSRAGSWAQYCSIFTWMACLIYWLPLRSVAS